MTKQTRSERATALAELDAAERAAFHKFAGRVASGNLTLTPAELETFDRLKAIHGVPS